MSGIVAHVSADVTSKMWITVLKHLLQRVYLLVIGLFLCTAHYNPAFALSRRVQEKNAQLQGRMHNAEMLYLQSVARAHNGDPDAMLTADKSLEDMEDILITCTKEKNCPIGNLLTSYKRLLKDRADDNNDASQSTSDQNSLHIEPSQIPLFTRASQQQMVSLFSKKNHAGTDIMVHYNAAIQVGIRRWATELRPQLMSSYENYQHLKAIMWPEWEKYHLPEALLFGIIAKESCGRVHSSSRSGALGLMQFMPATGQRFGLGTDAEGFDTRLDAQRVARASAEYISERFAELQNNVEMALAGYNSGEGRAARIFLQSGGKSFWNASVYAQFPAETQDYVPMVIAAAWLFLHPQPYGIQFPSSTMQAADFRLARPTTLYALGICLGNFKARDGYFRTMRNLNPRYAADVWIPGQTQLHATKQIAQLYQHHCINGQRAEVASVLASAQLNTALINDTSYTEYSERRQTMHIQPARNIRLSGAMHSTRTKSSIVIKHRQSLAYLAQTHACSKKHLAHVNHLSTPYAILRIGQRVSLEGCQHAHSQK